MAGLGRKVWSAGEVMTATNVQNYLQDQVVQVHASSAARSSVLGTAVSEGMVSYRSDFNIFEIYDGSNWVGVNERTITSMTATAYTATLSNANGLIYASNASAQTLS